MTLRLLVDTCVWLDLAKDYRNLRLIEILDELVTRGDVSLIVPEILLDEYHRNKERVLAAAVASQKEHFKLVRAVVKEFGKGDLEPTLSKLDDVRNQVVVSGELSQQSVEMVEVLLASSPPIQIDIYAKSRAADRALDRRAPFHVKKDSMADAFMIETYFGIVEEAQGSADTFAFVTTNTNDFSQPGGHNSIAHGDFAGIFNDKSVYSTSLPAAIQEVGLDIFVDDEIDQIFFSDNMRLLSDIREAENLLYRQVWYNRHQNLRISIERGQTKVIPSEEWKAIKGSRADYITDDTWKIAREAAQLTVAEIGKENVGPWDDFEWGMLNGKLSALRWVLGEDWDMLDT